ncbi:MAG: hypothetical protein AABW41_00200 [Nanoarchaeota archaeon]
MKIKRKARDLVSIVLATSLSLGAISCGKKSKPPTTPAPIQEIIEVTTTIKAAEGDTITTTDIDGKTYKVMIPANSLSQDAKVTLKKSDIDFNIFNFNSSSRPLEINLGSARLVDSAYVILPINGDTLVAISNTNGYFRYENLADLGSGHVKIPLLRNSTALSTNATAQINDITTWVGDLPSQQPKLNRNNADFSNPNRPVVLLIHGLGQKASDLSSLEDRIRQTFPVATFEYPTTDSPYRNALKLKEELGKVGIINSPLYLVGYSMGSLVARDFIVYNDSNNNVKKFCSVAGPNNGFQTLGAVKSLLDYLLNLYQYIIPIQKGDGIASLVQGSAELNGINRTRGPFNVDYFFIGGICNCALSQNMDLTNILPVPHDGAVYFNSLDMNQFSPHELARLNQAARLNLNHLQLAQNTSVADLVVQYFTTPTLEDKVLITSTMDGNDEIYETNLNFSNFLRRTNSPNQDWQVSVSKDKSKVAYNSSYNLYVANIDFTNPRPLTANTHTPQWHPNNNTIVFVRIENSISDLYKINSDGSGLIRLTNDSHQDVDPSFSSDGNKIIFASDRDGPYGAMRVYTMDTNGNNISLLQPGYSFGTPRYSPDGSKIVYTFLEPGPRLTLWTSNSNGANLQRLTSSTYDSDSPVWSPDGDKIMFLSNKDNPGSVSPIIFMPDIYIINSDGSNLIRKTTDHRGYKSPFWYR